MGIAYNLLYPRLSYETITFGLSKLIPFAVCTLKAFTSAYKLEGLSYMSNSIAITNVCPLYIDPKASTDFRDVNQFSKWYGKSNIIKTYIGNECYYTGSGIAFNDRFKPVYMVLKNIGNNIILIDKYNDPDDGPLEKFLMNSTKRFIAEGGDVFMTDLSHFFEFPAPIIDSNNQILPAKRAPEVLLDIFNNE